MANVTESGKPALRRDWTPDALGVSFDVATIVGVTGAFAVIAAAMVLGGSPKSFVDLPAVLIVFAGTALVTAASFTVDDLRRMGAIVLRAVLYRIESPSDAAQRILFLSDRARQSGPLGLGGIARPLKPSRFLGQAVELVADGLATEEIDAILTRERGATRERHRRCADILRRAGETAPAMGLIGTLVGLIQMLGNLDDPSTIGPSMAIALLTTFYGALLATLVFNPLASKLERTSEVEATVNEIYAIGAVSISRQENPRRLELLLNTLIAPGERVAFFD